MSGFVLRECVTDECTMDHTVTLTTDEQARLMRLVEPKDWARLIGPLGGDTPAGGGVG